MEFKEIFIEDKVLFEKYMSKSNLKASEYNFTNFFMWRKFYRAKYAIIENSLCVVADPEFSKPFVFMPMGELKIEKFSIVIDKLREYFEKNKWPLCFSRVEEEATKKFKKLKEYNFIYDFDRDNSDYLYGTSDLINLSGKKFNKKRNHLNAFLKENTYDYQVLDNNYIGECKKIMQEWCDRRECKCNRGEYCERHANTEVLNFYEELDLKGALIKINNKFEAFTLGEKYTDKHAVIHVEKANEEIRGLYNIINRDFVKNEFGNTEFINREQDLGEQGLRKSKLSYQPLSFINKYNIYL